MSVSRERGFPCKQTQSPSAQILHPAGRVQESTCIHRRVKQGTNHRVDRVLGLFSCRPNRDSPTPSPRGEYVPLPLVPGETVACGEGVGGSQSDKRTDTVVFQLYMYFVVLTVLINTLTYLMFDSSRTQLWSTQVYKWIEHLCHLFSTACTLIIALCKD